MHKTLLVSRLGNANANTGDVHGGIIVGSHLDQLRARVPPTSANAGLLRLVIGKHIIKEAWELEVEKRAKVLKSSLRGRPVGFDEDEAESEGVGAGGKGINNGTSGTSTSGGEGGAALGLGFGEKEVRVRRTGFGNGNGNGAKRTAGATIPDWEGDTASKSNSKTSKPPPTSTSTSTSTKTDIIKETSPPPPHQSQHPLDKLYDDKTRTLVLPSALPTSGRSRLLANNGFHNTNTNNSTSGAGVVIPVITFPHALIVEHPWSATLKVLTLSNRRMDVLFMLGCGRDVDADVDRGEAVDRAGVRRGGEGLVNSVLRLESVEEVMLDGCQLPSLVRVRVCTSSSSSSSSPYAFAAPVPESETQSSETKEPLFPLLARIFPSLTRLDLSYNTLTTLDGVEALFSPSHSFNSSNSSNVSATTKRSTGQKGLKVLRVRGNKIDEAGLGDLIRLGDRMRSRSVPSGAGGSSSSSEVDGAQSAAAVDGEKERNRDRGEWKGEEIDLRENEIAKVSLWCFVRQRFRFSFLVFRLWFFIITMVVLA